MDNKYIAQFYEHPDWRHVEDVIITYANSLLSLEDIDLKQPADDVKCEVVGRLRAYEIFCKFVNDSKLVGRPFKKPINPFQ